MIFNLQSIVLLMPLGSPGKYPHGPQKVSLLWSLFALLLFAFLRTLWDLNIQHHGAQHAQYALGRFVEIYFLLDSFRTSRLYWCGHTESRGGLFVHCFRSFFNQGWCLGLHSRPPWSLKSSLSRSWKGGRLWTLAFASKYLYRSSYWISVSWGRNSIYFIFTVTRCICYFGCLNQL